MASSVHDKFEYSSRELRRVQGVQFGIMSPEEVVRHAGKRVRNRFRPARGELARVWGSSMRHAASEGAHVWRGASVGVRRLGGWRVAARARAQKRTRPDQPRNMALASPRNCCRLSAVARRSRQGACVSVQRFTLPSRGSATAHALCVGSGKKVPRCSCYNRALANARACARVRATPVRAWVPMAPLWGVVIVRSVEIAPLRQNARQCAQQAQWLR